VAATEARAFENSSLRHFRRTLDAQKNKSLPKPFYETGHDGQQKKMLTVKDAASKSSIWKWDQGDCTIRLFNYSNIQWKGSEWWP